MGPIYQGWCGSLGGQYDEVYVDERPWILEVNMVERKNSDRRGLDVIEREARQWRGSSRVAEK